MSFTRKAAFGYVPLLSRVVLAAAFIPAGWDKIMGDPIVYTGADAALLRRMGVDDAPAALTQHPVYQDSSSPLRDRVRPRGDRPSPCSTAVFGRIWQPGKSATTGVRSFMSNSGQACWQGVKRPGSRARPVLLVLDP